MENRVSYCGLLCQGCPLYWATREDNKKLKEKMLKEIARMSNEKYGTNLSYKDITDCDGCLRPDENIFPPCKNCEIRNCAKSKNLDNCAYCKQYICEKMANFFKENPESKDRLDFIRSLL